MKNGSEAILHYIFPGRFQPFHNDHLRVIETFMNNCPGKPLIMAVVRNYVDKRTKDTFDRISDENFLADRNPFDANQVLSMVGAVARHRYPGRIVTTLIPRPSSGTAWEVIKAMLPGKRIWIIQKRGEEWDEDRVGFFGKMGDEVLRIMCPRSTSGKIIREYLAVGKLSVIKNAVPPEVLPIIQECI